MIAAQLQDYDVEQFDIADDTLDEMARFSHLIVGIPTWDFGELQEDWDDLWDALDQLELSGTTVALFGLGDQIGYGEWFQDAMGLLHDKLKSRGARMVGYWPNEGYKFTASKALTDDEQQFVGLALDQDSQSCETDERIEQWVPQVLVEFGLKAA